jgi:phosphate transport system permease protein
MASFRRASRSAANAAFLGFCYFVTLIALTALGFILWSLLTQGVGDLSLKIFTMTTPSEGAEGGLLEAIIGSVIMCTLAMLLAAIIGVLAGTWLAEYGGDTFYAQLIRYLNDILLSAPSILVGVFVATLLVIPFRVPGSALAASVALALIAVPIITRATEDVLKLQPTSLRESGIALGTPQWTTIRSILWKSAGSGMLTGGLLAFARISGETAPLLLTAFGNPYITWNLFKPMNALPLDIYTLANTAYSDLNALAWTAALIVAIAVLGTNILARIVTRERRPS